MLAIAYLKVKKKSKNTQNLTPNIDDMLDKQITNLTLALSVKGQQEHVCVVNVVNLDKKTVEHHLKVAP